MKERIVVDNSQKFPRTNYYVVKNGHYDVGTINYVTPEAILNENKIVATKEQVPETFEEIKQLLHNDKKVFNKSVKKIEISEFMIEIHFKLQTICFLHSGDVVEPNCLKPIVTGRTPAQMWTIIKNLIGEE